MTPDKAIREPNADGTWWVYHLEKRQWFAVLVSMNPNPGPESHDWAVLIPGCGPVMYPDDPEASKIRWGERIAEPPVPVEEPEVTAFAG